MEFMNLFNCLSIQDEIEEVDDSFEREDKSLLTEDTVDLQNTASISSDYSSLKQSKLNQKSLYIQFHGKKYEVPQHLCKKDFQNLMELRKELFQEQENNFRAEINIARMRLLYLKQKVIKHFETIDNEEYGIVIKCN